MDIFIFKILCNTWLFLYLAAPVGTASNIENANCKVKPFLLMERLYACSVVKSFSAVLLIVYNLYQKQVWLWQFKHIFKCSLNPPSFLLFRLAAKLWCNSFMVIYCVNEQWCNVKNHDIFILETYYLCQVDVIFLLKNIRELYKRIVPVENSFSILNIKVESCTDDVLEVLRDPFAAKNVSISWWNHSLMKY